VGIPAGKCALSLACAAGLIAVALLSPRAIPYNMDEFVHYHALGCATAPQGKGLPAFRDGCGLYDLRLPFTVTPLPLRSYYYIGSLPAVPFYPFWRAFGGPIAVRVQGAIFLLIWIFLAVAFPRVRVASLVLAGLLFPVLAVTFLIDEGPVGLSAILLVLGLLALRRAIVELGPQGIGWGVAAGLALFLGLFVKLVFAWWFLAVAAWGLWQVRDRHGSFGGGLLRTAPALAAAAAALAIPAAILLSSVDIDGQSYVAAVRRSRISAEPEAIEAGAGRLLRYVTDGSLVAPRHLTLPHSPLDGVPAALAFASLALVAWRGIRRRSEVGSWTIVALATLALASLSAYSQWPHHFAFALIPLVFGLAIALDGLERPARVALGLVLVTYWATLAARWPAAVVQAESSRDKDDLLEFVRAQALDRDTLQVHATWGTYYIAQLFGDPARIVQFVKGISDDPSLLRLVRHLAAERARPILLVSGRRWDRLQTPAVEEAFGPPRRSWQFGQWHLVLYPAPHESRDPAPRSP
jgi:hypothetical protein